MTLPSSTFPDNTTIMNPNLPSSRPSSSSGLPSMLASSEYPLHRSSLPSQQQPPLSPTNRPPRSATDDTAFISPRANPRDMQPRDSSFSSAGMASSSLLGGYPRLPPISPTLQSAAPQTSTPSWNNGTVLPPLRRSFEGPPPPAPGSHGYRPPSPTQHQPQRSQEPLHRFSNYSMAYPDHARSSGRPPSSHDRLYHHQPPPPSDRAPFNYSPSAGSPYLDQPGPSRRASAYHGDLERPRTTGSGVGLGISGAARYAERVPASSPGPYDRSRMYGSASTGYGRGSFAPEWAAEDGMGGQLKRKRRLSGDSPSSTPGMSLMDLPAPPRVGRPPKRSRDGPLGEHRSGSSNGGIDELDDDHDMDGMDGKNQADMDKDELRKLKNRDKQRRLRLRRANQLNSLQEQSADLQSEVNDLRAAVSSQAKTFGEREQRYMGWIRELEMSLRESSHPGARDQIDGVIAGLRDKFRRNGSYHPHGSARSEPGEKPSLSAAKAAMDSRDHMYTWDPRHRGSGSSDASISPLAKVYPVPTPDGPKSVNVVPPFRPMTAPRSMSIPDLLSPEGSMSSQGMLPPYSHGEIPQVDSRTSLATSVEGVDLMKNPMPKSYFDPALLSMYSQPSAFPLASMLPSGGESSDRAVMSASEASLVSKSLEDPEKEAVLSLEGLALLREDDVRALTDSQVLRIARFLIKATQPSSAYTPGDNDNTDFEEELRVSKEERAIRESSAAPRDPSKLLFVDSSKPPSWRKLFTSAQVYLLMRALMDCCHPAGSKAFFDGKRVSELPEDKGSAHARWEGWEGRDKRIDLVPAMALKLRIIGRNELADQPEDLSLNSFLVDMLFQARLYGNAYSMYCWELPDAFWDRWSGIFIAGKRFCRSLRAWRRKDGHPGATPFQIIMGTEKEGARRKGGIDLPPKGWKGDDGQTEWRTAAMGTKKP